MTEDENHWCDAFDILVWQTYVELKPESTRLLNVINCTEMTVDLKYIRTVLNI